MIIQDRAKRIALVRRDIQERYKAHSDWRRGHDYEDGSDFAWLAISSEEDRQEGVRENRQFAREL